MIYGILSIVISLIIVSALAILYSACVFKNSFCVVLYVFLSVVIPFETPSTNAWTSSIGVITSDTTVFGMSFKLKSHPIFTLDGYPEIYCILDKNSPNCTLLDFISIP